VLLDTQLRAGETALSDLDRTASRALAASLVQRDGWTRVSGVALWHSDVILRGRVQQRLIEFRRERDLWNDTLRWPASQIVGLQVMVAPTAPARSGLLRKDIEEFLVFDPRAQVEANTMVAVNLITIGIWPVLAIVWAFLWRGGLSYLITGIVVVRRDGRKAARWQCAWRAFLFWAPLFALQAAPVLLDYWFWSASDPQTQGWTAWLPLLASLAFYAIPVTLVGYIVLALWTPTRSWHDRLAGTLLMPR